MRKDIQIYYFMPDQASGGGGDDPSDGDEELAARFKYAVLSQNQSPSTTADPWGLSTHAEAVITRMENTGYFLLMLAPMLRPIAAKMMEIKYPSDKVNGQVVAHRFKDFDWNF